MSRRTIPASNTSFPKSKGHCLRTSRPPSTAGSGSGAGNHVRRWGEIVIAVDCSGSINARQLGLFEAEVRSILAGQQPRLVHVLYFDTEVQRVETYQACQPVKLAPVGGGGTDFRPCFRWLKEQGITPQTLVFLTDLWGTLPSDVPPYPVLWASTGKQGPPSGRSFRWKRRSFSRG